jgi:hypothetical protein
MGCFLKVKGKIIIGQNRTSDRSNSNRSSPYIQLVNDFSQQSMDNPMGTTGAIVAMLVGKGLGFLECLCHSFYSSQQKVRNQSV